VWHASISDPRRDARNPEALFAVAEQVLAGVGDPALGEWREVGDLAVHLRRRVSPSEADTIGPVVDVRGTWEHTKRLNRIRRYLPERWQRLPDAALL